MITLFGTAQSRASRTLLALEEFGLQYSHVPLKPWVDPTEAPRLALLNPNIRVPVLDDSGRLIWESMAINLYLGDRYGGPLWPDKPPDRASLYQWSVWSQTSIDVLARHRNRRSKDPETRLGADAERLAALAVLDGVLRDRPYLLGDSFTLADLNVAATLSEPWENGRIDGDLDPADHGLLNLADWLIRCTGRASWDRVRALP